MCVCTVFTGPHFPLFFCWTVLAPAIPKLGAHFSPNLTNLKKEKTTLMTRVVVVVAF